MTYSLLVNLAVALNASDVNIPDLSANVVVQNVLNIAYFLMAIIAVIVIIVSGITYATSAGNAASVTKAKNQILYAVIGIIVVITAYAITNFILSRFQ